MQMQNIGEEQTLTVGEIQELLEAINQQHVQLAVAIMAYSGARISEVLDLKENDIDMEKNQLFIRAKKGKDSRYIPINGVLKSYLENYFINVHMSIDLGYIFPTSLLPKYINQVLLCTTKKFFWDKKVTCSILRKSFALNLLRGNICISQISNILGHHSIDTTVKYLRSNLKTIRN